jgi:two-component system response regulator LytT
VIEDEWVARNYLVELVESSHLAEVVGAVGNVEEAHHVLTAATPGAIDVAFVDVQLVGSGDAAGLDLVRKLAGRPHAPCFVLATAFKEHALEAFELGVVDYLLKPFTEERVEQCLARVRERKPEATPLEPLRIVAHRGRNLVFLDPHEVWAFEASARLTYVHTEHGTFDVDLSLSAIEASFGRTLTRVHRNWLVNASHIRELERDGPETRLFVGSKLGTESSGLRVPVARERAQGVRDMLLATAAGVRRG